MTRLKGQALSYHSCLPEERVDYNKLTKALSTRFTPVQLPVVQTTLLFHERKMKAKEDVDSYAQDLRNLFQKAYPRVRQGSKEAEETGKSVLAHQFAAGLLPK